MMARGVAPPGSDSSSSGFSSDEDIDDVPQQLNAASSVPNVQVEVLNEDVKADQNSDAVSAIEVPPAALSALTGVNSCCLEASRSVLDAETPFAVQYDQYTAAIGHITYHWPNSELYDAMTVEEGLKQYHMLRMELYRRFQKAYPLTEDMYMQWIGDASAIGGEETVKKLFKLARGDYWSVPLTLQYLNFIRDSGDAAALERAMDEAQKTLGTHFARGHEIWALCRELTTDKFDEQEDGELEKERALRDLFCKQMQLPLDQNDLVMSEFRAWDAYNSLDGEATGRLEKASERQSKTFAPLMKKLRGFEARLTAAPGTEEAANPEQTWTQYLNFVKHRVAPLMANDKAAGMSELGRQIVVCLYERAVSSMCLSPTIWASYLDFLEPDKSGACGSEKVDVAYRAVRNVSFDSSAWSELFVEMERQRKSMHEISQFARAELLTRSSPPIMDQFHFLTALLTWCDAVRRYASTSINGKYLDDTVQKVESLDATKENVEALFKDISTLKDVRLVVKTRGDRVKSRGMAYVQFTDEAGVEEGLKLNGSLLDGHPLRVERSKPPSTSASTPGAKPSTCTQKNDPVTLFVGDLNVERSKQQVTEEQLQVALQQAMQSAGELVVVTRVSILKDRYGKLKNYGLVELAEPSQVAFCLSNAAALQAKLSEQVTVKPSRFSIAHILEQQEKQQKQTQQRKAGAAAKAGAVSKGGANGPHARPSTRLNIPTTSLMPRALRRKLAAQDTAAKTTTSEPTNATTVTPKSNEDFRKMLFKK
ncbi:Squamous cell carcinoma antigen recognized by T-cells 3 [Phytophthora boehmeriae]|uniref:Squamous cell carcinoma antigen recognized by T-cells 3 n=1 Tax=Phytophthora boehmeriae TaxID=109152 RepID=A0A8T1VSE3_9STRA|nr:Squamous cell carcinoma antigen recognized by T-cells 3 [Phytophthora boehmeriae]